MESRGINSAIFDEEPGLADRPHVRLRSESGLRSESVGSVTSEDVGMALTGDLAVLKRYLDQQFARQLELLTKLRIAGTHSGLREVPSGPGRDASKSPRDPPREAATGAKPELLAQGSLVSEAHSSITERLQVNFEEPLPRRDTGVSCATTGSIESFQTGGRRASARKSFVRGALVDQEEKARSAASKLTFMRRVSADHRMTVATFSWQSKLGDFVRSPAFGNFIMLLIVSNAILLGVEIDVSARVGQNDVPGRHWTAFRPRGQVPSWFGIVNTVLVFIFVAETTLKLLAMGCHEFWKGEEFLWNAFDFVIVSLSVIETIVDWWAQTMSSSADGSNSFRIMRALRLARTLRGIRIIRLFRYFSALRGLILSIFSTMGSLLWTLLLLLILFYTFSCIFAQLVTDFCRFQTIDSTGEVNAVPDCPEQLDVYWGTVMDSMITLFMSITGGINWREAYRPLTEVSLVAMGLMNLYIVIGFFTILNVVTGVFVNTAIESASADKDLATLKQMQKRIENMSSLQEVFQEMDQGDINAVSIEDLEKALAEEKLGTFLESLGISTDDAWSLFVMIDTDRNGLVDMEEFVTGCMQLRGPAKSLQVAKMAYENKLTRQAIKHLHDDVASITRLVKQSLKYRLVRESM